MWHTADGVWCIVSAVGILKHCEPQESGLDNFANDSNCRSHKSVVVMKEHFSNKTTIFI